MGENRWPKVCLREEIRSSKNGYPSKWGKAWVKALLWVGNGERMELVINENRWEEAKQILEKGIKTRKEQEIQGNWSRIEKSNYCKGYGK